MLGAAIDPFAEELRSGSHFSGLSAAQSRMRLEKDSAAGRQPWSPTNHVELSERCVSHARADDTAADCRSGITASERHHSTGSPYPKLAASSASPGSRIASLASSASEDSNSSSSSSSSVSARAD